MTLPVTVERGLALVKKRYRLIVLGGFVCSAFAFFIGLLTPYLYRSEAIVEIPFYVRMNENRYYQESNDVFKAASLIRSPRNLIRVAQELISDQRHSPEFAVPHSFSAFDFGMRFRVLGESLRLREPEEQQPNPIPLDTSPKTLASLLKAHISVQPDSVLRTLRITYEAGASEAAQDICTKIVEGFISLTRTIELQELKRQEGYLEKSIEQQLTYITEVEKKMQRLVERYPQLSAARGKETGTSLVAQKYLSKKDMLNKLDYELESNTRLLTDIRSNLVGQKDVVHKITTDVTGRIVDEISELEFKRLQLMRISGYNEKHPRMQELNERLRTLKQILIKNEGGDFEQVVKEGLAENGPVDPDTEEVAPEEETTDKKPTPRKIAERSPDRQNFKSLYRKKAELTEKNRRLEIQRNALRQELKSERDTFRKVVDVNFKFDSLSRELRANTAIANELFRDLQKTRLVIAGTPSQVTVLSPPTQPLYSSNISVKRRTFFGFFVGGLTILTFLLLMDFFFPILITPSDPEALGLRSFGLFDKSETETFPQVAGCLESLRGIGRRRLAVGFSPHCEFSEFPEILGNIASSLKEMGQKVTIVAVEGTVPYSQDLKQYGIPVEQLSYTAALARLPEVIREARKESDWVLVTVPPNENIAIEPFLAPSISHLFFVMRLGQSNLISVEGAKRRLQGQPNLQKLALVFDAPPPPAPDSEVA